MRRSRWWLVPILAASLLVTGCGPVNAGTAAREEFEAQLDADFGEHVEEVRISDDNTLPFAGRAFGSVVLRPETPPDVLESVFELVTTFRSAAGSFEGSGVVANGVGICVGDPQIDAKRELRSALHAAGASLSGEWPCSTGGVQEPEPYWGPAADLDADVALIRSLDGATGLRLEARLTDPPGTASGLVEELPDTAGAALAAIAAAAEVVAFELKGGALTVAIDQQGDTDAALSAAEAAAGPDLAVHVVLGSLDPSEQAELAELEPVLEELRRVPGVAGAEATVDGIAVRTLDPAQAPAVLEAATSAEALVDRSITILVGEGTAAMRAAEYVRPAGATTGSFDAFAALVADSGVSDVTVREAGGGREGWVDIELTGPLLDAVRLKPVLPTGVDGRLSSVADESSIMWTIADPLRDEHVSSGVGDVDLAAFITAWNAAR